MFWYKVPIIDSISRAANTDAPFAEGDQTAMDGLDELKISHGAAHGQSDDPDFGVPSVEVVLIPQHLTPAASGISIAFS